MTPATVPTPPTTCSSPSTVFLTTMALGVLRQHLLQLAPLFRSYTKTLPGLACFLREVAAIRIHCDPTPILPSRPDAIATLSIADIVTLRLEGVVLMCELLRPFCHCAWDAETQRVITTLFDENSLQDVTPLREALGRLIEEMTPPDIHGTGSVEPANSQMATGLDSPALVSPPPSAIPQPPMLCRQDGNHHQLPLTLDQVPEDWRDLVEGLIAQGKLRLADYASLDGLERFVDEALELPGGYDAGGPPNAVIAPALPIAAGEVTVVGTPAGTEMSAPARPPPPLTSSVPARAPPPALPREEREAIAEALQLQTTNFRTKEEALALYLAKQVR